MMPRPDEFDRRKGFATFAAVFVVKGLAFIGSVTGDAGNLYLCNHYELDYPHHRRPV